MATLHLQDLSDADGSPRVGNSVESTAEKRELMPEPRTDKKSLGWQAVLLKFE